MEYWLSFFHISCVSVFFSVLLTDFFKYYWIKFYHQDNIGYDWPAISLSFSYPNFLIIILATSLTYLIIIVHNQMTLFFKYLDTY
jgi:hypothetical protein